MPEVIEKNRMIQLMPDRIQLAEQWRQDWVVNASIDTTVEDLVKPEYWSHVAEHMNHFDRIEVRAEDGSWLAELVVRDVQRNYLHVSVLEHYKFSETQLSETSDKNHVDWKGPHHKFAVIRNGDNEMISKGHKTKDEAILWMREHEKVVG